MRAIVLGLLLSIAASDAFARCVAPVIATFEPTVVLPNQPRCVPDQNDEAGIAAAKERAQRISEGAEDPDRGNLAVGVDACAVARATCADPNPEIASGCWAAMSAQLGCN